MQIVVGIVLDRYGARRLVLLGTITCGLGVLLFAGTADALLGGLGRAATGFGAAFAFVSALYIVNHWFAPERFAVLSGAVNGVGMLGTAIGAVALTDAIQHYGWQAIFLVTGGVGFILFGVALLFLREAPATGDVAPNPHIPTSLRRVLGEGRTWLIALMGLLYYMPVNVYGGLWGNDELTHDHGLAAVQAETAISMIFWGMAIGSVAGGATFGCHRASQVAVGRRRAAHRRGLRRGDVRAVSIRTSRCQSCCSAAASSEARRCWFSPWRRKATRRPSPGPSSPS